METVRFGSPPRTAVEWLYCFAEDNEESARCSLWPWSMKYKGQAWAFRTAAELVGRVCGNC